MGIKLLVMKDRDKNEYRHYLQEYESRGLSGCIDVSDDGLCIEHNTYIVEIWNGKREPIDSIEFIMGTTGLVFGKAGRL